MLGQFALLVELPLALPLDALPPNWVLMFTPDPDKAALSDPNFIYIKGWISTRDNPVLRGLPSA